MDAEVIVSNIVDSTVSVAVKMHLGYMDKALRGSISPYFFLLFHLLHIDVWNGKYKSARLLFCTFYEHL